MIIIIGTPPPPRGGVAVYVHRKFQQLKSKNENVILIEPRNLKKLVSFFAKLSMSKSFQQKVDKIELHTAHPVAIFLATTMGIEKYIDFYDHNYSNSFQSRSTINKLFLKKFLSNTHKNFIVGEHLKANYKKLFGKYSFNLYSFSSYIDFVDTDTTNDIDEETLKFINKHEVVFINAAWSLIDDNNGNDLYGLHRGAEGFVSTFSKNKSVGYLMITSGGDKIKVSDLKTISDSNTNILFLVGNYDLLPFLKFKNVVLLRTTTTDGDSISIHEALRLKTPVIASDVVPRPKGVYTYEFNSLISFQSKLIEVANKFK